MHLDKRRKVGLSSRMKPPRCECRASSAAARLFPTSGPTGVGFPSRREKSSAWRLFPTLTERGIFVSDGAHFVSLMTVALRTWDGAPDYRHNNVKPVSLGRR